MQLPNGENAVVAIEKLSKYLLDPNHPRGKHKARVFQAACGLRAEHADLLRHQLLEAASRGAASVGQPVGFGRRYMIDWIVAGPTGEAMVRTAWIIRDGEDMPRFVTAHVV